MLPLFQRDKRIFSNVVSVAPMRWPIETIIVDED